MMPLATAINVDHCLNSSLLDINMVQMKVPKHQIIFDCRRYARFFSTMFLIVLSISETIFI